MTVKKTNFIDNNAIGISCKYDLLETLNLFVTGFLNSLFTGMYADKITSIQFVLTTLREKVTRF